MPERCQRLADIIVDLVGMVTMDDHGEFEAAVREEERHGREVDRSDHRWDQHEPIVRVEVPGGREGCSIRFALRRDA